MKGLADAPFDGLRAGPEGAPLQVRATETASIVHFFGNLLKLRPFKAECRNTLLFKTRRLSFKINSNRFHRAKQRHFAQVSG
jgi:hypothetical protein